MGPREHSGNRIELVFNLDLPSDSSRSIAEVTGCESRTHHGVGGTERSRWGAAQNAEKLGIHPPNTGEFGMSAYLHPDIAAEVGTDRIEDAIIAADIDEIAACQARKRRLPVILCVEADDSFRVRKPQWLQQNPVDHTEDGSADPDPQRESGDAYQREGGPRTYGPQCLANLKEHI
jgi:hypothetical protein